MADTTTDTLPLISITIPVYNEIKNLDALYNRLANLAMRMSKRCHFEFIFTDNHSTDGTWEKLATFYKKDARIRAIRFTKNIGMQHSILVNYLHTKGDAVCQFDADLQDPPELLETFFEYWRKGHYVVYGIRKKRQEGFLLNSLRKVGYWVISKMSEHPIPRDAGDFRLIDRKVINVLKQSRIHNPYLRGLIANMGFKQIGIPYQRNLRLAGKSKFGLLRLILLGITAVFNHSAIPLRIASISGIMLLGMSIMGSIYLLLLKLFALNLPPGIASTQILILFAMGFNSLLLGILGEYLLRIYLILRSEPIAVIEQAINFTPEELKF